MKLCVTPRHLFPKLAEPTYKALVSGHRCSCVKVLLKIFENKRAVCLSEISSKYCRRIWAYMEVPAVNQSIHFITLIKIGICGASPIDILDFVIKCTQAFILNNFICTFLLYIIPNKPLVHTTLTNALMILKWVKFVTSMLILTDYLENIPQLSQYV